MKSKFYARYKGESEQLENDREYTVFRTETGIEVYENGKTEPTVVFSGIVADSVINSFERLEGNTPMA